jgi:DNA-directed RNA polymerase subunit RPC12/RpoP
VADPGRGADRGVEHADLQCERCGEVTEHELHYVGRLLESVRCTVCGNRIEMTPRALVPAYLLDLEHRVATKPSRLLRRSRQDPAGFLRGLVPAIARQPGKFAREVRTLFR